MQARAQIHRARRWKIESAKPTSNAITTQAIARIQMCRSESHQATALSVRIAWKET